MQGSCPHCQQYARIKHGVKNGYQQYFCSNCGKCSSDSPKARVASSKTPCSHCGSLLVRKIGFTKSTGYQRWRCNSCCKYFSDSPYIAGGQPIGDKPKDKSIKGITRRAEKSMNLSDKYQLILAKVPDTEPDEYDAIPIQGGGLDRLKPILTNLLQSRIKAKNAAAASDQHWCAAIERLVSLIPDYVPTTDEEVYELRYARLNKEVLYGDLTADEAIAKLDEHEPVEVL